VQAESESKRAGESVSRTLDTSLAGLMDHFEEEPEDILAFQQAFSMSASLQDRYKQAQVQQVGVA